MRLSRSIAALLTILSIANAPVPRDQLAYEKLIGQAKAMMQIEPAAARRAAAAAAQLIATDKVSPASVTQLAAAEWLEGEAALRMNELAAAAPLIQRALGRLRATSHPTKLKGDLLMSLGGVHAAGGDSAQALVDYQAAHRIFQNSGEVRSQSIALATIGGLYQSADDNASALKYFNRAIDAYAADPGLSVSIYNNRGFSLKELKRFDQASAQFGMALTLARQMDSAQLQARILGNIARLDISRRDFPAASIAIDRGLALAERGEAAGWRPQLQAIAADLAFKRHELASARLLIQASFAGVSLNQTDASFREAHYTAYSIYSALADQPAALAHLQAMKRLDDQVWRLTASANTALMAARFDSANQETRIAKLKADDLAREVALEQTRAQFQRTLFGSIAAAAILVMALLAIGLYQSRRARLRLSASNAALGKALAAKTEFLATTSHEIRTPLNGILGMTQVMLADTSLTAAAHDRIGIVHGAGLTMRALVDDILDVAKMESGHLTLEAVAFDLRAMLADVTRIWDEQARAKGLAFTLDLNDCPRGISGDAGRLRQVVYNLLSNAVKFTAQGSVTVRAAAVGGQLRVTVADTGIGIAGDKHDEIFESFKQADGGTTRQFGGTGLGLAICRNIARAMGGAIEVDSIPGQGASFTLDIPFEATELPVVAAPVVSGGGLLIVERNPIARAMLKTVLEPRAGPIAYAGSCAEAVAIVAGGGVTRILIDEATVRLGDADPIAAIATLCAAGPPVAVLWTRLDDTVRDVLIAAGATQVIAKPIAGAALAALLFGSGHQTGLVPRAA